MAGIYDVPTGNINGGCSKKKRKSNNYTECMIQNFGRRKFEQNDFNLPKYLLRMYNRLNRGNAI